MDHITLRKHFAAFFESKDHKEVPGIPLIPQNDATTLFTGSGMQQLVPYLLGETHPLGTKLYNIQRCIRAQDINEVGDNRHDTFFEMLGNWSLGDYFKSTQLAQVFELYTNKSSGFGLDPQKLYVTVFAGGEGLDADEESIQIWLTLFDKVGIKTRVGTPDTFEVSQHITKYDATKNWWSRAGTPSNMPAGEVGGPDSEIFYDFGADLHLHENSPFASQICHVNCDCGRFLEIGNSVFIQYVKSADGTLKELPSKNVDFGGGLERILAATLADPDVFKTDVLWPIVAVIQRDLPHKYGEDKEQDKRVRIIADHIRSTVQLSADGIVPGPKEQSYVMRTLIRRAALQSFSFGINNNQILEAAREATKIYEKVHNVKLQSVLPPIEKELKQFEMAIENGKKEFKKLLKKIAPRKVINGQEVFSIFQSTGLPKEVLAYVGEAEGVKVDLMGFDEARKAHADSSRAGSDKKFKGGLADHSEKVVKYHTATHLIHQALHEILGKSVRQEGSNITGERLRFDFACDHKPTQEEVASIQAIVNEKIALGLPVTFIIVPKSQAESLGAKSFFKEKYPDMVKVYAIGPDESVIEDINSNKDYAPSGPFAYSLEFCGGPHVENTKEIGEIVIQKVEKIGSNLFRLYAK